MDISRPALYRHFANKEAILGDMLVGVSERLLTEARRRTAGLDDLTAVLATLVDWHVEFALDQPALIVVQSRDLASLGEADRCRVRRLQRNYVEIWATAIRAVAPGTDEQAARAAAHAVFGLINSPPR
ncbi:TetR/AcrR family transcriptional regulator [Micromonospora sp. NPDC048830]|uniref:TetR/AcrR family transcriptional regulator n=1 Tax=Micromonospora sp. NPDC048830 TaxID=3364257 RepID=UPI003710F2A8